jgi:hypothetical protein
MNHEPEEPTTPVSPRVRLNPARARRLRVYALVEVGSSQVLIAMTREGWHHLQRMHPDLLAGLDPEADRGAPRWPTWLSAVRRWLEGRR